MYNDHVNAGAVVTALDLVDEFLGKTSRKNTLMTLFAHYNEQQEKLIGTDITQSTFNKFDLTFRRLEEFLKEKRHREDIPLPLVDHDFVVDFHTWLKVDRGLSINSSEKLVRIFKRITTLAFKQGLTPRDPFALHKIKKEKKRRGNLVQEELQRILDYVPTCYRLEKVHDIFLFSCFTGCDYSTLRSLTDRNIVKTQLGPSLIVQRIKTDEYSQIKLLPLALEIIEKYRDKRDGNRLLPVMSSTNYNKYLKEIAAACGIEKNVTSHLARHTFASTVTLQNGISLSAVQKMLGHSDIRTTQIYADLLHEHVDREMDGLSQRVKFQKGQPASNYPQKQFNQDNQP